MTPNWTAFYDAIEQRWPDADRATLDDIDGDRDRFVDYIARITGQQRHLAEGEVADWTAGAIPADIRMSEAQDGAAITASGRYVPDGEDPLDDDAAFGDDNQAAPPMGRRA